MSRINICNCECGSFAAQHLTIPDLQYAVYCFNEHGVALGHDCEQKGPVCATSREAIERWNAGERCLPDVVPT